MVDRYSTDVDLYECWNEPNAGTFWRTGTDPSRWPAEYAALLHAHYVGAKAANLNAKVGGMVTGAAHLGYIGAVYDVLESLYGVPACQQNTYFYDVICQHTYCGARAPDDLLGADTTDSWGVVGRRFLDYRRTRAFVSSREGIWKPLYIGEFGYNTDGSTANGPVDDAIRAQYLTKAYRLIQDEGYIFALTWYTHDVNMAIAPAWNIHGSQTEAAFLRVPAV